MSEFDDIKSFCAQLEATHSERNKKCDEAEKSFQMDWDEEQAVKDARKDVKITKHPGIRNKVLGATRLLSTTEPAFSIPFDKNKPSAEKASEDLKETAATLWRCGSRVYKDPLHYDVALSMILFGEVHIAVTSTADLVEHSKSAGKSAQQRAEEIADMTPYIFDIWDPRTGYPEMTNLGLMSYYRKVSNYSGRVVDEFGSQAQKQIGAGDNRYKRVNLCHFWNNVTRWVWLEGQSEPLITEDISDRPGIPVIVQFGEGGRFFDEPEYQRQSFLYTVIESDLWKRQNMMLTAIYTAAFGVGMNPMYLYKRNSPEKTVAVDHSNPAGTIMIDKDEEYGAVDKQAIDQALLTIRELSDSLEQESTIYNQTLGQPLGGDATYSMVALLHQAGRLPLAIPQAKSGWGIADAVKYALLCIKGDNKKVSVGYGDRIVDIDPKEIPDKFELEALLDIALPQDRISNAKVAGNLSSGADPIVSKRWARETVLGIGQSKAMQREIWAEQAANQHMQLFFTKKSIEIAQAIKSLNDLQAQMAAKKTQTQQPGGQIPGQTQGQIQEQPPDLGIPSVMENGGAEIQMPGEENQLPPEEMM